MIALDKIVCLPGRWLRVLLPLLILFPAASEAQKYPWPEGELLTFDIYWPSGVALGEATLTAKSVKDVLFFAASVEVALPQGRILYKFSSSADAALCSREFRQSVQRSGKFWEEISKFDALSSKVQVSRDGHTREFSAGKCERDPLTYLYYLRTRAVAGPRPASDTLLLTGPLKLQLSAHTGENVKINRTERHGDRYVIHYPPSARSGVSAGPFELWLDGTIKQTPIAVRLPLPLATFSAELR